MKVFFTSIFLIAYTLCFAQNTVLDKTFGNKGIALTPNTAETYIFDFDTSGNIISVGSNVLPNSTDWHTIVTRHNKSGVLDSTFGVNGVVNTIIGRWTLPYTMTLTPDNKIFAAGIYLLPLPPQGPGGGGMFISKYNTDGTYDNSFGVNGIMRLQANGNFDAITVLPGNKIMAGGYLYNNYNNESILIRLNPDGSFDKQFGTNGMLLLQEPGFIFGFQKFKLLHDGNLLCIGSDYTDPDNPKLAAVKVDTDGNILNSFAHNGKLIIDRDTSNHGSYFFDVEELLNGNIFLFGYDTTGVIVKINGNGTLDSSFGKDGIQNHDYPVFDATILNSGKIVFAGNSMFIDGFYITMLDSMGILDSSFNRVGYININVADGSDFTRCVKVQGTGKIIVSGGTGPYEDYNAVLMRINMEKPVSVKENIISNKEAIIFPNPFSDWIFISGVQAIKCVRVLDNNGHEIKTIYGYQHGQPVHLANIPDGIYNIVIDTKEGKTITKRIVKL